MVITYIVTFMHYGKARARIKVSFRVRLRLDPTDRVSMIKLATLYCDFKHKHNAHRCF